jgi:hypothetical protein
MSTEFTEAQIALLTQLTRDVCHRLFGSTDWIDVKSLTVQSLESIGKVIDRFKADDIDNRDELDEDQIADWRIQYQSKMILTIYPPLAHLYGLIAVLTKDEIPNGDRLCGSKMEGINLWYMNRLRTDILGWDAL